MPILKWFDHTPHVPKCFLPLLQKFHRSGRVGAEVSFSFFFPFNV